MSRCFPFPPPGHEGKIGGGAESLIESIKLQKDKEREKKERRKEKKREKKEGFRRDSQILDKSDKKRKHYIKAKEDAAEQLEKSGLTEESGPPSSAQNPYDSDSTQDYQKKQKLAHTLVSHQNHGTVLRIRLPLAKHREAETLKSKESEPVTLEAKVSEPVTLKAKESEPVPSNDQPSFSGRVEAPVQCEAVETKTIQQEAAAQAASGDAIPEGSRRTRKMERKFRDVFMSWNPPAMQFERSDTEDLDWLVGGRERKGNPSAERCKAKTESLCQGNPGCSLEPRACYLPDVDMHALPYVVPF